MQSLIPVPGHGAVRLTTARYYTPSGRSIQALGIAPDILVKESKDDDGYGYREADLAHIITNTGGNKNKAPVRTDLPSISTSIPSAPPENWPRFELAKPATDFQLQQGLRVVRAMASLPDELSLSVSRLPTSRRTRRIRNRPRHPPLRRHPHPSTDLPLSGPLSGAGSL